MKVSIFILTALFWFSSLLGAELNCKKASNVIDKSICQNETLTSLEIEVTGLYDTLQHNPNYFYFSNELYAQQHKWKKTRNNECRTHDSTKIEACLQGFYEEQKSYLKSLKEKAESGVAIVHNKRCDEVGIKTKILVNNSEDICSKYTYLDNNARIKLTQSVLQQDVNNKVATAILNIVDNKSVIKKDHCSAYKNQEIYEESVVYINPNVISLKYFGWEYKGGAHGNGRNYYVNYDRKDGSLITWDTLFKNNKKFFKYVKKRVKNELMVPGFVPQKEQERVLKAFSQTGSFSIRHNGLYIEYGSYELAPYSAGYPSLTISKKVLKKYLSKKLYRGYFRNDGSVYLNVSCAKES